MLGRVLVLLTAITTAASCFIPPPIDPPQTDGGATHRPRVDWSRTTAPDPFTAYQTPLGGKKVIKPISIWLIDEDPQVMFANVFMDGPVDLYAKPIASKEAPPLSDGKRAFSFDFDNLCDEVANFVVGRHDLEFYFSDTGFRTDGERREPNPGGNVVSILYRLNCLLAPGTGPDAGL